MFDRAADFIMKHAKVILVLWIVVLLVAAPFALKAGSVMKYDVNDMASDDSESIQGLVQISQHFPSTNGDSSMTPILVVKYDTMEGHDQVDILTDKLNKKITSSADLSAKYVGTTSIPAVYTGGTSITMVAILYNTENPNYKDPSKMTDFLINDTPNIRALVKETVGEMDNVKFETYLTGSPALTYDMMQGAMSDLQKIDPFTVLLILILVGLFFRSIITSATPPITIGFAFVVVMALIFGIGTILNVFFITEMMLLVSMMGAGCDYCIFIIARYREELRSGKEHKEALHEAIKWAGESITTSACSVIIGFGAMCICSYSMVSTMGICLAVGIIVALIAALTLIPSILMLVGDRIFWPTRMDAYQEGGKATKGWYNWFAKLGEKYFEISSRFSLKHAGAIVIAAIIVTAPAAYLTFTNETSYDMIGSMQCGESGEGMDLMGQYANQGMIMPNYAVVEYDVPIAYVTFTQINGSDVAGLIWNDSFHTSTLDKLQDDLEDIDDNVAYVSTYFKWKEALTDPIVTATASALEAAGMGHNQALVTAVAVVENNAGRATNALALSTVSEMMYGMIKQKMPTLSDEEVYGYIMAYGQNLIDYAVNCGTGNFGGNFADPQTGNMIEVSTFKGQTKTDYESMMGIVILLNGGSAPLYAATYGAEYIKVTLATVDAAMSPKSMDTISSMEGIVNAYASSESQVEQKWVTGTAVVMYDVSKLISNEFTKIVIVVVVLILILLFFVMKSYITPLRSVITIMMSIAWTIALTHIVFVTWLGGEMTWLIPLILLVICLGLGMDYDILLTTRIKENVSKGMSNDDAIHHAVTHTGSVITICGLIMGGAFGTLMLSGMEMMQEFGFALCCAILIDALIVRTYIVPAIMHLLGQWNWKGPKFLQSKQ